MHGCECVFFALCKRTSSSTRTKAISTKPSHNYAVFSFFSSEIINIKIIKMDFATHKGCDLYICIAPHSRSKSRRIERQAQAISINGNNDCMCAIVRNKHGNECRRFCSTFSLQSFYFNWAVFLTQVNNNRHQRRRRCYCERNRCSRLQSSVWSGYSVDFLVEFIHTCNRLIQR